MDSKETNRAENSPNPERSVDDFIIGVLKGALKEMSDSQIRALTEHQFKKLEFSEKTRTDILKCIDNLEKETKTLLENFEKKNISAWEDLDWFLRKVETFTGQAEMLASMVIEKATEKEMIQAKFDRLFTPFNEAARAAEKIMTMLNAAEIKRPIRKCLPFGQITIQPPHYESQVLSYRCWLDRAKEMNNASLQSDRLKSSDPPQSTSGILSNQNQNPARVEKPKEVEKKVQPESSENGNALRNDPVEQEKMVHLQPRREYPADIDMLDLDAIQPEEGNTEGDIEFTDFTRGRTITQTNKKPTRGRRRKNPDHQAESASKEKTSRGRPKRQLTPDVSSAEAPKKRGRGPAKDKPTMDPEEYKIYGHLANDEKEYKVGDVESQNKLAAAVQKLEAPSTDIPTVDTLTPVPKPDATVEKERQADSVEHVLPEVTTAVAEATIRDVCEPSTSSESILEASEANGY